jgi:aminopeptidase N
MSFRYIVLFTFLISSALFSQSLEHQHDGCGKFHDFKNIKSYELNSAIEFNRRNYDILQIDLEMDWRNPLNAETTVGTDRYWSANEKITLVIDSANTRKIEFDVKSIRIDSVKLSNKNYKFNFINNLKLELTFQENLIVGDTLIFDIGYTYIGKENIGFVLVGKEDAPERLAYTMSQPNDARYWVVCNDNPYEKQMFTLRLKVPSEFIGASSGLYKEKNFNKDYNEFYWEHEYPIASYLMVANASKFYTYENKVARIENNQDSILIDNYIWEVDYTLSDDDGSKYYADNTLDVLPDMITYFQTLFGPYPFEKFGTVVVEKFWAAGMEHQSIQTIRRRALNGEDGLLAHELAHMWLGDLVTPTSWRDIWLNEGGAQWSEALWMGNNNDSLYNYKMVDIKNYYIKYAPGIAQPPIYLDDIESTVFGNNRWYIIYQKSSWIYHQLRNFIGKEEFFEILKDYLQEYAYTSIDGEVMIKYFEDRASNPLIPIRKFFDQFLYSAGHPIIDFRYEILPDGDKFIFNMNVKQIQKNDTKKHPKTLDMYEFPLVIDYYKDGNLYKDTLIVDEEYKVNSIELDFQPDSVRLNEAFSFFQTNSIILNVNSRIEVSGLKSYPNPIINSEVLNIDVEIEKNGFYSIDIIDFTGTIRYSVFEGNLVEGTFSHSTNLPKGLNKGVYFIRVNGINQKVSKLIIN